MLVNLLNKPGSLSLSRVQTQRFIASMLDQEAIEIKIRHRTFYTGDITIARVIRQNRGFLSQENLAVTDILGLFQNEVELREILTKDRESYYVINPAAENKSALLLNEREVLDGSFVDDDRPTPAWPEIKGLRLMVYK